MNFHDITGQRFGRLVALSYHGNKQWLCQCDCGNSVLVQSYPLTHGSTRSCGCLQRESRYTDFTGMHFGRLKCLGPANKQGDSHCIGQHALWLWRCDCGNEFQHEAASIRNGGCVCCPECARQLKSEQAKAMAKRVERDNNGRSVKQVNDVINGKLMAHNSSGVRGVSWHRGRGKWTARVQRHGKTVTVGYYDTIEEATLARQKAVNEIYGERK